MVHLALALVAAEKTAETSYAIYLYCIAGVIVVGGSGYAASEYFSTNDDAVNVEHVSVPSQTTDATLQIRPSAERHLGLFAPIAESTSRTLDGKNGKRQQLTHTPPQEPLIQNILHSEQSAFTSYP